MRYLLLNLAGFVLAVTCAVLTGWAILYSAAHRPVTVTEAVTETLPSVT